MTFWSGRKESVMFWKPTLGCEKNQTVRCFRKNTQKNQPDLNGIEGIYVVVVVVFIFTRSFFLIILFFILIILFHFIFFTFEFWR